MPKIIDNIEDKIYNSAFELFTNKGYDSVNMKMVAKKTGIAVGTLYNYHQNKKNLYINVFKNSWKETFTKIDRILQYQDNKDKLKKLIDILYEDISKRRGFARELIKSNELKEVGMNFVEDLKNKLKRKINKAVKSYEKYKKTNINKNKRARLVQLIFTEIIALNSEFSEGKKKNIDFIMELVDSIIE